ncbi:50S ribosomal protein L4 [Candidatus Woesearchaeota archaeon]|nr:50S ribosomal protein L4 [Candidatus Woesearchaeota archaeon]
MKFPAQFEEPLRKDLIIRAVLALRSKRQPYGAMTRAGIEASAKLSRRRRAYRGAYNKGISRIPRKTMTARGSSMNWVGALAPHARGGIRAHPPKAAKQWEQKINDKERKKAIRSALGATINKDLVQERGHKAPDKYPFVLEETFEKLAKSKEVMKKFQELGLKEELARCTPRIQSGKTRMRGRKTKTARGPLLVVSQACPLSKAARTIPGVDVRTVTRLNAEVLAPGTHPGRLTIYTKPALEIMEKKGLFL